VQISVAEVATEMKELGKSIGAMPPPSFVGGMGMFYSSRPNNSNNNNQTSGFGRAKRQTRGGQCEGTSFLLLLFLSSNLLYSSVNFMWNNFFS
jgi:hypothetical protein